MTDKNTFTCNDCSATGGQRFMLSHDCAHNQYVNENGGRCEDYPCCGHTDGDGCRQLESHTADFWRDNPHLLCDHETGHCEVDYDDEPDAHDDPNNCPYGGCSDCDKDD